MSASASASASASISAAHAERASVAGTHKLRSLEYGLDLLRQFTSEQPVRGISELADGMNVSRPTAHRYASTCLDLGYLEQAQARRYRLARRCAEPGMAMLESLALTRAARPIVRELRRSTGRTVSLAVLRGAEVLYLQRCCGFARGQYLLEKGLGAGSRLEARGTAAGRALLAELDESKDFGLTVEEQDARTGARGLALAVRGPAGSEDKGTAAIEIVVPAEAISAAEMLAELGAPLRAAGAALQAALAGDCTEERVNGCGPQGGEGQADQGRSERGVLRTRASEDADRSSGIGQRRPSPS